MVYAGHRRFPKLEITHEVSSGFRVSPLKELKAKVFQIILLDIEGLPITHGKLLGSSDRNKDKEFTDLHVPWTQPAGNNVLSRCML